MPFFVDEDVFWLEVSVCYALDIVEIFEDEDNFGCVEFGCEFVKPPCSAEVAEDFATGTVF